MPRTERTACKRILDAAGYLYVKAGYDLLAVSHAFFARGLEKHIGYRFYYVSPANALSFLNA
jgi:hypothetical protein